MHKIVSRRVLGQRVVELEVEAPAMSKKAQAGQFFILRIDETGERIPLTFAGWDPEAGTIMMAFLPIGKTTNHLASLKIGDSIRDIAGPMGEPTHLEKYGHVVFLGGGVGTAEALPVARALRQAGNKVTVIQGARNEDLLMYEDELAAESDQLLIATDDGSKGYHGFGLDLLMKMIEDGEQIDMVHTIGPAIMMKMTAEKTRPHGIHTVASLNPIMMDGTGMCGACRVLIDGETKFGCVDGPEFDAHKVDWDLLMARQTTYKPEEEISNERFKKIQEKGCECEPAADPDSKVKEVAGN